MISKLPNSSKLFSNIQRDSDERGGILSIVDTTIQNVSIIECNPKSIRSNHYHKNDYHFMYVLDGEIDYFFKTLNDDNIKYIKVKKGDTIFTPKLEVHATYFQKKTRLIVSSGLPRDQETYEKDTVRVPFVNLNNLDKFINLYAKL